MISKRFAIIIVLGLGIVAAGIFLTDGRIQESIPSETKSVTQTATSTKTERKVAPPVSIPASKKGMVNGKVLLGPTCPVERIPPDPNCSDRPYQTMIQVKKTSDSNSFNVQSDSSGFFNIALDPGTYSLTPKGGGGVPPTCQSQQVTVVSGKTQSITLTCDSGIR